jgi:uroporphyrinogen decarboxylase
MSLKTNRFYEATLRQNNQCPPVWMMRQAGRYHQHYQNLKKSHSFVELCKTPELAAEVAMGPIEDFDFDAAILFSDILFPLEAMGMPLDYNPGPILGFLLDGDCKKLRSPKNVQSFFAFQKQALEITRQRLPVHKGLIGFVGAPLTLFCFAVEGSHKKNLNRFRSGVESGLYEEFFGLLRPMLLENMLLQAQAGCDAMALFDTTAGELSPTVYEKYVVPHLEQITQSFKQQCPKVSLIYYSKHTSPLHWNALKNCSIDVLGIDWNHPLSAVISDYGDKYAIQGNFDPQLLRDLNLDQLQSELEAYFTPIQKLDSNALKGWICGLGHGVLPLTPEENVRCFVRMQREIFGGL